MDFQQKASALNALSRLTLGLTTNGEWYASVEFVEVGGNGFLAGLRGFGASPEAAVDCLWSEATTLPSDRKLVIRAYTDERREVRWNGFMWAAA